MKVMNRTLAPPVKPPFLGVVIELDKNEVEYIATNADRETGSSVLDELVRHTKDAHQKQGVALA